MHWSPPQSSRFSTRVGDRGTCAVLGFDHGLQQLSWYDGESLNLLQAHPFDEEDPGLLLARAQMIGPGTDPGWGLRIEHHNALNLAYIKQGFIASRWPLRSEVLQIDDHLRISRSLTYIEDGSLIQVVASASTATSGRKDSGRWSIGGNIRLRQRPSRELPIEREYVVKPSHDLSGFTISSLGMPYCIEVELFLNGIPYTNFNPKFGDTITDLGKISAHCNDCINITRSGDLEEGPATLLVARFTPRRRKGPRHKNMQPPLWKDIKERFGFSSATRDPFSVALNRSLQMNDLHQVRHMIARSVAQLLFVAIMPKPLKPESTQYSLIDNLVKNGSQIIDHEACL